MGALLFRSAHHISAIHRIPPISGHSLAPLAAIPITKPKPMHRHQMSQVEAEIVVPHDLPQLHSRPYEGLLHVCPCLGLLVDEIVQACMSTLAGRRSSAICAFNRRMCTLSCRTVVMVFFWMSMTCEIW